MPEKISVREKNHSKINDLILKERIKLLTSDYNNNTNLIAVIDVNREFVFANNSLLTSFQYTFPELKEKKLSDLFHSIDKPNDINKLLLKAEKSPWSGKIICYKKDASSFSSNLKINSIQDDNDSICGYEIIAANVTGAKPDYKKLFEFLLKLEKSHHSFPDLLIIMDEERNIIEIKYFEIESDYFVLRPEDRTKIGDILPPHIVSEITLAINKIKSGQKSIYLEFPLIITGNKKIFEARISKTHRPQYNINLRDITKIKQGKREIEEGYEDSDSVSDNSSGSFETRLLNENFSGEFIKTKDGRFLSLEGSYSPIVDEYNKILGFIATEKSAPEQRELENRLVNSEKKFSTVWEKSFDGMRLTDSNGNIVAVNPAYCNMFEIEEAQLLGKPFTVVYHEDLKDNERRMKKYKNNFKSRNYEFQRYSKSVLHNGKSLFLFVNYSYIDFTFGEPLVLGIFRNITDVRKAQDELNKVEKLAAIGKMSSYLSHEIKNPLASIKNYVDVLLNNKEMPENTKPILNILRDSLGNLSKLLNNVLLFSSSIKLIKINISIYDLVEKVRELLNHKIIKKNIQFKNNLSANVIRGDYVSLQSVFFNLVENAIDAVSKGGIIELNDSIIGGNYLVRIIDNGCGIVEPEKVFEAFHSEKKGGTGLGLAIAKKIMEMHEGNIQLIKSKQGRTIFELYFPTYGIG